MLRYRVPASTTNLGHGFDALGMALALYNTISVEPGGDTVIAPEASDGGLVAMATRVREACQQRWQVSLPGFSVKVAGEVPIARGLGSSSTILLGVAAACQQLAARPFAIPELIAISAAIEGHPDNVAAAALGGFVVVGEVDGCLRTVRFAPPPGLVCWVFIPDFEVKTSEARRILPSEVSKREHVIGLQRTALITAALARGDLQELRGLFADAWHERHRAALNPHLERIRTACTEAGAIGTILSGSGSTVLAFAEAGRAVPPVTDAQGRLVAVDAVGMQPI